MHRHLLLVLLVTVVFGLSAKGYTQANLIRNPDFTLGTQPTGVPADWTIFAGVRARTLRSRTNEPPWAARFAEVDRPV